MSNALPIVRPESVGLPPAAITAFIDHLENHALVVPHSTLFLRHGQLAFEGYWAPFTADTKHRLYSCSKSFVSLAIGFLADEGRISLDDPIIQYFPDKLPPEGPHPYIAETTIRHMLKMASANALTTYSHANDPDWVKTFFTYPPSHRPGHLFFYDTSASHTLGGLVERITGQPFLDYLRPRLLDPLGVSPDTTCLPDPSGVAWGGSGVLCRPRDFAKVALTCLQGGVYQGKQLIPAWYLKEATSKQIDTFMRGNHPDSSQGYGYQFWRVRNNGFAFHGMGGQLAVCLPDKDFLMVTTMDVQWQGGYRPVYDALWTLVYPALADGPLPLDDAAYTALSQRAAGLSLPLVEGLTESPMATEVSGKTYRLSDNKMGINQLRFVFTPEGGTMNYTLDGKPCAFAFAYGKQTEQAFPLIGDHCVMSAAWADANTLNMRVLCIGDECSELRMAAYFSGDIVTLHCRRATERLIPRYDGMVSGVWQKDE